MFCFQIRLDFDTFIITGPVTTSLSIAKATGGVAAPTAKTAMSHKTTCATDQFSVSNAPNVPTVCGTLTGDHSKYGFLNWQKKVKKSKIAPPLLHSFLVEVVQSLLLHPVLGGPRKFVHVKYTYLRNIGIIIIAI